MRIAITGGTGFVGRHLARALLAQGHSVTLLARGADQREPEIRNLPRVNFTSADLSDISALECAFAGCDAVAHLAGINRELGSQTYQRVHIQGTANVVEAARRSSVRKIVLLSFLRARPNCGSPYHESKWAAEELVRNSHIPYTILKAGMIYGHGDHMLDHLSRAFHTLPVLATVGFRQKPVRPLAVEDLMRVLSASLVDGRLMNQTIAITGREELLLSDAARRVAAVLNRNVLVFPAPIWFHRLLAHLCEWTMKVPLVSQAQVRILTEGVTEAFGKCDSLPSDLQPRILFTADQIQRGLPDPEPFGFRDLRCIS